MIMGRGIRSVQVMSLLCAASLLAACGGGAGSDPKSGGTGTLKLGITDAPVDAADAVVVQFTGVLAGLHRTEEPRSDRVAGDFARDAARR